MLNNGYSTYKRQSVTTLTPIEIVIKLYDECERQLNRGIYFIENRDFAAANVSLSKSADVMSALRSVLDMKINMSNDLDNLYAFFIREILAANMKKDVEKIKSVLPLIADLKDAFVQISKLPKEQLNPQPLQNVM